jgi:hypothetical protein
VEYGLAADAPLQEGVERSGRLAPRAFELDLAVQPPLGECPLTAQWAVVTYVSIFEADQLARRHESL